MKLMRLLDGCDDWINPIVIKELRQAVKNRMVTILLLVFLVLQLAVVTIALLASSANPADEWSAGRDVFAWLQGILVVTLVLFVPAYACVRLAAERSDQNVDLLFISTLRPHSIIAGKFFAAFMLGVLIFSACAPFMTFTYLLRGIDIPTILFLLGLDLLLLLFATMFTMMVASVPGGIVAKVVVCFLGFIPLLFITGYAVAGSTATVYFGGEFLDRWEFQVSALVFTVVMLVTVGLFFFYAVTLVSPPTSNRILPLRIYVLSICVLSIIGMCIAAYHLTGIPFAVTVMFWGMAINNILGYQMLISICERDQLGPRMQRQIPNNLLLRIPAFFLYTGSAGGIAFTLVLMVVTLILGGIWQAKAFASITTHGDGPRTFEVGLVCLGYTYCYSISAVLARVYLFSGQVRNGYTWLVKLLLVGLGSAIPPLIAYLIFPEQMQYGSEAYWWKLPSLPFSLSELTSSGNGLNDQFLEICLWFLGIWSVLVTVLALPWFIRQVAAFQPRTRSDVLVAELVVESAEPAAALPQPSTNGVSSEAVMTKVEAPEASVQPG